MLALSISQTPVRKCTNHRRKCVPGSAVQGTRITRVVKAFGYRRSPETCVLVTNDDGIESKALAKLAQELRNEVGVRVVTLAPDTNQSAASMSLTLKRDLQLTQRADIGPDTYSLSGSPADCVAVALDGGCGLLTSLGLAPLLTVSGPNYGSNVSSDILYSGTVGAARVAAMLGVPALAVSSSSKDASTPLQSAVSATIEVVALALAALQYQPARNWPRAVGADSVPVSDMEFTTPWQAEPPGGYLWPSSALGHGTITQPHLALLSAFSAGDLLLNLNVPPAWDPSRGYHPTRLGVVFYHDAYESAGSAGGGAVPSVYLNSFNRAVLPHVVGSDVWALQQGVASITTLQTWPDSHPLQLPPQVMAAALEPTPSTGLPAWLSDAGGEAAVAAVTSQQQALSN